MIHMILTASVRPIWLVVSLGTISWGSVRAPLWTLLGVARLVHWVQRRMSPSLGIDLGWMLEHGCALIVAHRLAVLTLVLVTGLVVCRLTAPLNEALLGGSGLGVQLALYTL